MNKNNGVIYRITGGGKIMRVVICDDEQITCSEIEQMLRLYAREKSIKLEVDVFFDGSTLIDYLKREKAPDILFLDIELPGMNGVEVGKYIRNILTDPNLILIYISCKTEYALELFQNQPFDFLIKPIEKEQLYQVMEKIFRIIGKNECNFVYKNQGNSYKIMYKDILYFQSDGRKINVIMENGVESFYGKLSEIEQICPDGLFLRIHKSYLINIHHAKEITYKWIKMINGDVLDISKANRVDIRRKVMEIMLNENRYNS